MNYDDCFINEGDISFFELGKRKKETRKIQTENLLFQQICYLRKVNTKIRHCK